jgi:hypothetical protein
VDARCERLFAAREVGSNARKLSAYLTSAHLQPGKDASPSLVAEAAQGSRHAIRFYDYSRFECDLFIAETLRTRLDSEIRFFYA